MSISFISINGCQQDGEGDSRRWKTWVKKTKSMNSQSTPPNQIIFIMMDFLSDVFEEMSIGISFKSLEYTYTSTFTYLFTFTQGEVSVGSIDPMNFEKKDILMQKLLSLFV